MNASHRFFFHCERVLHIYAEYMQKRKNKNNCSVHVWVRFFVIYSPRDVSYKLRNIASVILTVNLSGVEGLFILGY